MIALIVSVLSTPSYGQENYTIKTNVWVNAHSEVILDITLHNLLQRELKVYDSELPWAKSGVDFLESYVIANNPPEQFLHEFMDMTWDTFTTIKSNEKISGSINLSRQDVSEFSFSKILNKKDVDVKIFWSYDFWSYKLYQSEGRASLGRQNGVFNIPKNIIDGD